MDGAFRYTVKRQPLTQWPPQTITVAPCLIIAELTRAGIQIVEYRPVAKQSLYKQRQLLGKAGKNITVFSMWPLLYNGAVRTPLRQELLLETAL